MDDLIEICGALKTLGNHPGAMATVVQVEGSAYRRPGARLLATVEGRSWGMISGGCLEYDVLNHARNVLDSGIPRMVRYDSTSSEDIVFGTGLGCNGVIDVFIEPVTEYFRSSLIEAVERCQTTRQPGAIATRLALEEDQDGGERHAFLGADGWEGNEKLKPLLANVAMGNKSIIVSAGSEPSVFIQPLLPPRQLIIFGGWLDVVPLVRMAKETGFQVTVIDSRRRESSVNLFREADFVLPGSPREAIDQIQFDDRTAAVLMNHNFERDQEALEALASVTVPFVGLLGPNRRKQRLLEAAKTNGVSLPEEFIECLHGPAGLDIGANTPQEIALSILGEILSVLNGRNGNPIRERILPLHATTPSLTYA